MPSSTAGSVLARVVLVACTRTYRGKRLSWKTRQEKTRQEETGQETEHHRESKPNETEQPNQSQARAGPGCALESIMAARRPIGAATSDAAAGGGASRPMSSSRPKSCATIRANSV